MPDLNNLSTEELIKLYAKPNSTEDLIAQHKKSLEDYNKVVPIQPTATESFLRGAAQGATLGFADEFAGGLGAAQDVVRGPTKLRDIVNAYQKRRDESRAKYEQAERVNPLSYTGGQITGGIGTAFIPGLGFMNAEKGAMLGGKLLAASKAGGVMGAGTSTSDLTKGDVGNFAEDVAGGAATGTVVQGALSGLGKAAGAVTPTNMSKKLANIVLNTPEHLTQKYIDNPEAIKAAKRIYEVGTDFEENALEGLKKLTTEGSSASRDTLAKEGKTFLSSDIARIYHEQANNILEKSEGIISDPQKLAAYNFLKDMGNKFAAKVDENTGEVVDRVISSNRLKDEVQSIQRAIDYSTSGGSFSRIDDAIKKDAAATLNETLKAVSPEYRKQMLQVAKDTELLNKAKDLAASPQGYTNLFKRSAVDKYGSGQIPVETLKEVDQRLGTNYLQQAEDAMVKEALDKSITNGSMNVNKFSNMVKDVPGGKVLGPLLGATVDKYGRKATMSAVDAAAAIKNFQQTESAQRVQEVLSPFIEAARKGNPTAILTMQLLSRSNPNLDPNMQRNQKGE